MATTEQIIKQIDQEEFAHKTKQCYEKYGFAPIKYRDKSGITLNAEQVLDVAARLGVIQKH